MTINPCEWTAINAWAIHTRSLRVAAKVAATLNANCKRSRQSGVHDGIEWMCLARFDETVAEQVKAQGAGR